MNDIKQESPQKTLRQQVEEWLNYALEIGGDPDGDIGLGVPNLRDALTLPDSLNESVIQDDIAAILRALGISDHARPISPHEVVQTIILPALAQPDSLPRISMEELRERFEKDWVANGNSKELLRIDFQNGDYADGFTRREYLGFIRGFNYKVAKAALAAYREQGGDQ